MAVPFGQMGVSSRTLDPLGLVAGMYEELGLGEVLDRSIGTPAGVPPPPSPRPHARDAESGG